MSFLTYNHVVETIKTKQARKSGIQSRDRAGISWPFRRRDGIDRVEGASYWNAQNSPDTSGDHSTIACQTHRIEPVEGSKDGSGGFRRKSRSYLKSPVCNEGITPCPRQDH